MTTLIVGGGLLGLSTAVALQQRGEAVRVLEALDGVALETSYANGGIMTPSMPEPWNGPGVLRHMASSLFDPYSSMKLRLRALPSLLGWGVGFLRNSTPSRYFAACRDNYLLARYSQQKTLELARARDLQYDAGSGGTLSVVRGQNEISSQLAVATQLQELGLNFRQLSVDEIVALEPALASVQEQLSGGIWYPDDVRGDAHLFCLEMARLIEAGGGAIETGVSVARLVVDDGAVVAVDTSRGMIDAERVVIAAGTRSPALLRPVGQPIPVQPAKGYSVTIDCSGMQGLPQIAVLDETMHAGVVPLGERLRLVGTAEFAGFDKRIRQERVDNLFRLLDALFPQVAQQVEPDRAVAWAGLRPMSNDGRPIIGPASARGLFVNTGHGPLGWTMALGSAHLLADQILGRDTAIDCRPYLPDRH